MFAIISTIKGKTKIEKVNSLGEAINKVYQEYTNILPLRIEKYHFIHEVNSNDIISIKRI